MWWLNLWVNLIDTRSALFKLYFWVCLYEGFLDEINNLIGGLNKADGPPNVGGPHPTLW